MNIKLEQYKVFNEAAATLSFSLAAKNLYMSQSAVSQSILSLEKELQTQLFIRHPKGVTLTNEGILLYQNINEALSLITSVENQLINYKTLTEGELTIGAGDTLSKHFVLPYIARFHELYPGVNIKVINRTSLETIALLKSGQIDIGFVNLPIKEETIEVKEWFKIHDIFVSKTKEDKIYRYKDIAKMPLIMLETSANTRRYVDHIFAKEGVLLTPSIELGAHDLLLEFTKNNLGIACVIQEFSELSLHNKRVFPLTLEHPIPPRHLGYCYLKRRTLSPACLKFIELIKDKSIKENNIRL